MDNLKKVERLDLEKKEHREISQDSLPYWSNYTYKLANIHCKIKAGDPEHALMVFRDIDVDPEDPHGIPETKEVIYYCSCGYLKHMLGRNFTKEGEKPIPKEHLC